MHLCIALQHRCSFPGTSSTFSPILATGIQRTRTVHRERNTRRESVRVIKLIILVSVTVRYYFVPFLSFLFLTNWTFFCQITTDTLVSADTSAWQHVEDDCNSTEVLVFEASASPPKFSIREHDTIEERLDTSLDLHCSRPFRIEKKVLMVLPYIGRRSGVPIMCNYLHIIIQESHSSIPHTPKGNSRSKFVLGDSLPVYRSH